MQFIEGSNSAITALAFSPDGRSVAVGNLDGVVSVADSALRTVAELGGSAVQSLTFESTGTMLLCAGRTGWYGVRVEPDPIPSVHVPRGADSTAALVFLNDEILVIGSGERSKASPGQLELRNIATGRRLEPRFREPSGVRAVAAHGPTRTVAWANWTSLASIWQTQTLKPRTIALPLPAPALAFHPDGERIAIIQDYGVKIFDVRTHDEHATLKGHSGRVTCLAYSPDGHTIATGSWDQTIRLWDAGSGALRATFNWGIERVHCLAFAPDGLRLAAGGGKGTLAICDVD